MKRAILVLGPMSTGTRLCTRILVRAGCAGDHGHEQVWDTQPIVDDPVVWRRSYPHGIEGRWPDVAEMLARLDGYDVRAVVTVRDPSPTAISQLQRHSRHVATLADAQRGIQHAYELIWSQLARHGIPATCCVYESLILHQAAQQALAERLGLTWRDDPVEIRDRNGARWGSP